MKIHSDNAESQEARIELIPLIDVIFCILTFFILAAVTFTRQAAISVDLPRASTGAPQMREMLIVSIDLVGQLYLEQQPVTREELQQALLAYQQSNPTGLMVLYASQEARYSDVVSVLDLLRSVGGDRVALATLPESATQPEQPSLTPGQFPTLPAPGSEITPTTPFTLPETNSPIPGLSPFPEAPNGSGLNSPQPSP